ncbi:MAG: 50S ribosomal protein L11 methyltransferase [Pseudomonadota bacterium]|uniref:50S ribosomal protein L11 methyltransferase n=1 Tax=Candidatus Desulfatibia profunda TaxID=2841695 RepID=A0A8J6NM46_9BACT|nr:50S ribosomal protein L11 methyltransferase [Candidatus Desulfatibia profunda]MBL7179263.1 50S ribosomal protein L11 methyltransferase [Desulfobacterales bacterium]MBU0699033.1 50S ribosomal protein L11 methyltransferase [Pseudomonadota bacterium]
MIESEEIVTPMALIREAAIEEVSESREKLTPPELEKRLAQKLGARRAAIKTAIRKLVDEQELTYSYHYGCSFLEISFNKPTRISDRVVLKPPGIQYGPGSNDVVIDIQPGASFGSGEHPTTRLAVRGIEQAFSRNGFFHDKKNRPALDIGTGSGVLAIVAASLGATRVLGVDIDPCAIAEAKKNVQLNNLEHRIKVRNWDVETIDQTFALITANLRYPTVKRLSAHIAKITRFEGVFIVSGIKTGEVPDLIKVYSQNHFACVWEAHEKDWVCLVLARKSQPA